MNNNNIDNKTFDNFNNFIARMQKEDLRNKKLMLGMFFIYLAFAIFYTVIFLINPDPELSCSERVSGIFYVAAFIIGTWFFRWQYKKFRNLDYTLPLKNMLEKTEERYRFFSKKWIPAMLIVVLISVGISVGSIHHYNFIYASIFYKILIIQFVYWAIMVISGFIGYLIWRKRSMPLWRYAKSLLKELVEHQEH